METGPKTGECIEQNQTLTTCILYDDCKSDCHLQKEARNCA
mgnify:CR=1 FL=1